MQISLVSDNHHVRIEVEDDGSGFDTSTLRNPRKLEGYGLFSIGERLKHMAGDLEIISSPGGGTRCIVKVPVDVNDASPS